MSHMHTVEQSMGTYDTIYAYIENTTYRQISNIRCTKSQNLNVSHLVLQLSLGIILKPGVKSRMKM